MVSALSTQMIPLLSPKWQTVVSVGGTYSIPPILFSMLFFCVSSKSMCWNLIHVWILKDGTFGKWLGHMLGSSHDWSCNEDQRVAWSLQPPEEARKHQYDQNGGTSPDTKPADSLGLGHPSLQEQWETTRSIAWYSVVSTWLHWCVVPTWMN